MERDECAKVFGAFVREGHYLVGVARAKGPEQPVLRLHFNGQLGDKAVVLAGSSESVLSVRR